MDPATMALIASLVNAGGSVAGGLLGRNPKETRSQKQKRKLIDELLASVSGGGQYSDLFRMDEDAFQKSYVDPAKSMFRNQIAPQIEQSYIYGGQQRGTGMEDQLARAGVELDQLLNQQYMQFQQGAMDRKSNLFNSILGMGEGVQPGLSSGEKMRDAASGYLTGEGFGRDIDRILRAYGSGTEDDVPNIEKPARKGYAG
jgi:hypothetical protein